MTSFEGSVDVLREFEDLTTNHEKGGLLLRLIEEVVQLRTDVGRAIVVGDTPLSLGAGDNVCRTSAASESPVAVRVVTARLLRT